MSTTPTHRAGFFADPHALLRGGVGGGMSSAHSIIMKDFDGEHVQVRSLANGGSHAKQLNGAIDTLPTTFQVVVSVVLGVILVSQLLLTTSLFLQRKKRVFQFAQTSALFVFLVAAATGTAGCYLFVYVSNTGCLLRGPVIFTAISVMASTVAARAWRISSLMTNPLMTMGGSNTENSLDGHSSRIELMRTALLRALSILAGCECTLRPLLIANLRRSSTGSSTCNGPGRMKSNKLRLQVSSGKMMLVIAILAAPQLMWQIVTIAVPGMRPSLEIVELDIVPSLSREECISPAPGAWPFWVGVILAAFPLGCAYLLNSRPKRELDQLPDTVDELSQLQSSLRTAVQILLVGAPTYYMAIALNVKAYACISMVLGLVLPLCHQIVYLKVKSMDIATTTKRGNTATSGSGMDRDSKSPGAYASKMVDMYERIGQDEMCVAVVDETLMSFSKNKSSALGIGLSKAKEEVGAGFTKKDLENISSEELRLIIKLLHKKGQALIRMKGFAVGQKLCTAINVESVAIYENCPAARDLDPAIIFPVYSICGAQLKGGMIQQDDARSLERDLADRFSHEAHVHAYHLARALVQQADIRAAMGLYEEAFELFEKMKSIYRPGVHAKLLTKTYAQDRCAQCFAFSALWYMQQGKIDEAIERCELVVANILPTYDPADVQGIYNIFIPLIRVLKWNGRVHRAREVFETMMPEAPGHRMAIVRKPMLLLLSLCSNDYKSTSAYSSGSLEEDARLALELDIPEIFDKGHTSNGWSMQSFTAELCLELARRLDQVSSMRNALIQRGIQLSFVADGRIRGEQNKIKHLAAYEAHRSVYSDLLKIAERDAAVSAGCVYDTESYTYEESFSNVSEGASSHGDSGIKTNLSKRLAESVADGDGNKGPKNGDASLIVLEKKKESISGVSFSSMVSSDSTGKAR